MFIRKVMVAVYTSIFAIIVLSIFESVPSVDGGWVLGLLIYSTYLLPVIFIYGITASILSEKLSFRFTLYPNILSLAFHLLFGLAFILPYGILFESLPFLDMSLKDIFINPITIWSVIFSIIFFFIDYILKEGFRKKLQASNV